MFVNVLTLRRDDSMQFEWDRLHACRPIPLGALPVWFGICLYAALVAHPWAHASLLTPLAGGHAGLLRELLLRWGTPVFWIQVLVFWLLPWMMFERRLIHRTNTPADLDQKSAVLIRLFLFALLFYPLIRLGYFGITHIARTAPPTPTMLETLLFDDKRPILQRYLFSLGIALTFGLYTLSMVVLRLRLAQWAAMRVGTRAGRFALYALSTVVFAALVVPLKRNVYNLLVPPVMGDGGLPGLFLQHYLPWFLVVAALHLAAAHAVHRTCRGLAPRMP